MPATSSTLRQLEAVRLWLDSPQPPSNRLAGIRQALDDPEYRDRLLASHQKESDPRLRWFDK